MQITGVRFEKIGKKTHFFINDLNAKCGENVIVEVDNSLKFGTVCTTSNSDVDSDNIVLATSKMLRIATASDRDIIDKNVQLEKEALIICKRKIEKHKLKMNLIDAEYAFNHSKLVFYFSADNRIDFRELVKDLASIFRTRIELRQVGVRDEAKLIGGLGPCGRPLCCTIFMNDFEPISIKVAKEKRLSLNPLKISGICGRLMCCLKYDADEDQMIKMLFPDVDQEIDTPKGKGLVLDINFDDKIVKVKINDTYEEVQYTLDELKLFHNL